MSRFSKAPPKTADEFLNQAAMATTAAQPAAAQEAAPAVPVAAPELEQVTQPATPAEAVAKPPAKGQGRAPAPVEPEDDSVYRTLTLRLNKTRYKRLKMLSTMSEIAIQQLLTEALDDYLPKKEKALGLR